ncbi:MAG TPA: hypothetical protein VE030_11175 [Burkholderiales bacterium]|nr:hypothetical protein [Burkholderiales bacterium]
MSPLLDPAHPLAPKFWRNETGGELQPAVMAYLTGEPMTLRQIALMRAYLQQWIDSPVWNPPGPPDVPKGTCTDARLELEFIRAALAEVRTRAQINEWLHSALSIGIDPL